MGLGLWRPLLQPAQQSERLEDRGNLTNRVLSVRTPRYLCALPAAERLLASLFSPDIVAGTVRSFQSCVFDTCGSVEGLDADELNDRW